MSKKKMTAAELMSKLNSDKQYQEKIQEKHNEAKMFENCLRKDELPLLDLLRKNGIIVNSVWDIVNTKKKYISVINILLDNLKGDYHPRTKAGIARALAIPEAKKKGWDIILEEYQQTIPDEDIKEANKKGYKEGLAIALSVFIGEFELDVALDLVQNKKHKSSRIYLLDAIWQFRNNNKVKQIVKNLENDNDLRKIIQEKF